MVFCYHFRKCAEFELQLRASEFEDQALDHSDAYEQEGCPSTMTVASVVSRLANPGCRSRRLSRLLAGCITVASIDARTKEEVKGQAICNRIEEELPAGAREEFVVLVVTYENLE
jgi:hypothetical protein